MTNKAREIATKCAGLSSDDGLFMQGVPTALFAAAGRALDAA